MGNHPVNLAVRFVLELIAFFFPGFWIWKTLTEWYQYPLMILLPILVAAIWGIFAVPNDPSRSGKTVIAVPGILRLLLELSIFTFGTWTIYKSSYNNSAWIFAIVVFLHYLFSYDRIRWLLKQK